MTGFIRRLSDLRTLYPKAVTKYFTTWCHHAWLQLCLALLSAVQ